ncbi:MAG: ester cyclase [candidate division NC10 bacterium]
MSSEENVELVKAGMEAFNAHDWDRFFGFSDESIVNYAPDLEEPLKGLEAYRERFETNVEAFPDQHIETTRVFGDAEWVVLEGVYSGTHEGAFPGPGGEKIPPTHKRVELPLALVFKIEGGKVTEEHDYYDNLTFMSQLGLAPE